MLPSRPTVDCTQQDDKQSLHAAPPPPYSRRSSSSSRKFTSHCSWRIRAPAGPRIAQGKSDTAVHEKAPISITLPITPAVTTHITPVQSRDPSRDTQHIYFPIFHLSPTFLDQCLSCIVFFPHTLFLSFFYLQCDSIFLLCFLS